MQGADFVCIRELTGGMYFGKKQEGDDYAYDTNAYSREEVERILKVAYQYAARRRGHLIVVDKANTGIYGLTNKLSFVSKTEVFKKHGY